MKKLIQSIIITGLCFCNGLFAQSMYPVVTLNPNQVSLTLTAPTQIELPYSIASDRIGDCDGWGPYPWVWFNVDYYFTDINSETTFVFTSPNPIKFDVGCQANSDLTGGLPSDFRLVGPGFLFDTPCLPNGQYLLSVKVRDVSGVTGPYYYSTHPLSQYLEVKSMDLVTGNWVTGNNFCDKKYSQYNLTGCVNEKMFPNVMTININYANNTNSLTTSLTSTNQNCNKNDGSAIVTKSGGTSPYSFQWSKYYDDVQSPSNSYYQSVSTSPNSIGNLSVGNYRVIITDGSGCKRSHLFTVNSENPFNVSATATNSVCDLNGTATASASGGVTSTYYYYWDDPNSQNTQSATGLASGNYSVTAYDSYGCSATTNVSITNTDPVYTYPDGLEVNSNLTWNQGNTITVKGAVKVKRGTTLTISNNTKVEFAPGGNPAADFQGIVVEPNALLIVDNATLKSINFCNAMWDGIEVRSSGFRAPLPVEESVKMPVVPISENGKIIIRNNAIIKDAHIGVSLYRRYTAYSPNGITDYGTGEIDASGSKFFNNRISIAFNQTWLKKKTKSRINDCIFSCSGPLINSTQYNNEGVDAFISINNTTGVTISANTFQNIGTFAVDKKGTGIRSTNAGYSVIYGTQYGPGQLVHLNSPKPNTFINLNKGIDAYATGGVTSNIRVRGNVFTNVQQGITANGSSFDEIWQNTFNLPAATLQDVWAINMYNTRGFGIKFNTVNGAAGAYGIITRNSGNYGGEITANTIKNLEYGTQTEQSNPNLKIGCNEYQGNETAIMVNPLTTGELGSQGTGCALDESQANNKFLDACSGLENHIKSFIAFDYFENPNNVYAANLSCVSDEVNATVCIGSITEPKCPTPPKLNEKRNLQELEKLYKILEPSLEKELLRNELIRLMLEMEEEDMAVKFLEKESKKEKGREVLVPSYLEKGESKKAKQMLDESVASNNEEQAFSKLFNIHVNVLESGRTLEELHPEEELEIISITEQDVPSATKAESVLGWLQHKEFYRIPEKLANYKMQLNDVANPASTIRAGEIILSDNYPNPFNSSSTVTCFIPEQLKNTRLIITDALGRIMCAKALVRGENTIIISAQELISGIYTYGISSEGKLITHKRMVVLK